MSKDKLHKLLAVIAMLLLTCLACAPGGGEKPAVPPTQAPTGAPKPTAALKETAAPKVTTALKETTAPKVTTPPTTLATLELDKTTFVPNEKFQVRFTAPASFPTNAWVGIIPSDVPHGDEAVNDNNDVDFRYLEGQTSGALTFTAPQTPGSYDLRLNDGEGKEVASVTFTVAVPTGDVQPTLQLDKTTFAPNEEFQVRFTTPTWYPTDAWVGLIPSDVPHGDEAVNDNNDVDFRYLEGQASGALTFTAPHAAGSYDLRLNDGAGKEVASVTFTVAVPAGGIQPTLQLDKTIFAPGEEIRVRFTAPAWYPTDAWVGLILSSVPHGDAAVNDDNDLDYHYLEGQTSGVLIFTAPDTPGSYDLRMNDTVSDGKEVASVTFEVK